MSSRVVVYSATANSDPADNVAARLRARGVEIVDEQPHMLLVSGAKRVIDNVLSDSQGWSISALTKVPPPRTRHQVHKPPSK